MPLRNIVIIALTIVFSLACYAVAAKNRFANLFAEVLDVVETESLQEVPREELFDAAMNGMLSDLDEHSQYISGAQFTAFDEDMRQEFGGVGMYVSTDPESKILQVSAAMPDTPAYRAGLMPGDDILEIEGKLTAEMDRAGAIKLMRGVPGTTVKLLIGADDGERLVELQREIIPVASVHGDIRQTDGSWHYELKEDRRIGYIRLLQFGDKSVTEFRDALQEINGKVDGLVVDLRNNSGGLLSAAVDICDMFLDEKKGIVQTKGRGEKLIDEHFSTTQVEFDSGAPLVILINRESASASEIVAACLRDYGRAVLVGEPSWGKGTVQNVIPIQRGESALKLTVASYWPPSGKNFDRSPRLSKTPGKYGVHPETEMLIEMKQEEIIKNFQKRNERDLETILPSLSNGEEPHVDRPLQKAIEHIKQLLSRTIVAA